MPNTEAIPNPQSPENPYIPSEDTQTLMLVQRHGAYDNRFPEAGWANPTDEERESLGGLTPEGIMQSQETAQERIRDFLQWGGDKVDFLVVASPTKWLGHPDGPACNRNRRCYI